MTTDDPAAFHDRIHAYADQMREAAHMLETMNDKLLNISKWCDAYHIDQFPEPDFKKVVKVLKDNGLSLDEITASNMRHVLTGVKAIING